MKALLLVLALGAAGYYVYNHFHNPTTIQNPVYSEFRVDISAESRKVNLVLFGKMADDADCRERAQRVWEKMIKGCKDCTMQLVDCKRQLAARYEQLFEDVPINLAYLSLTRGSRFERDGRMVIWGITGKESDEWCEMVRTLLQVRYSGQIHCVAAR